MPPGVSEHLVERDNPFGLRDRAAHDVTRPILSVFRPAQPNGGAILIIPGGGYAWVVVDKEGYEGARHFAALGYTVYVLRYRLPHQGWQAGRLAPLQDAQRAVRLVRAHAARDGIRPDAVMVMGFSAGGHLAGSLAAHAGATLHEPVDAIDTLSARPDVLALLYPVVTMLPPYAHQRSRDNRLGPSPTDAEARAASLELTVQPGHPPTILVHASDDRAVPVEHALLLNQALRAAAVPVALHVFERGGHGFGMRGIAGTPLASWPSLVTDWGQSHGMPEARAASTD
jgi:acetyl esterase/lipase